MSYFSPPAIGECGSWFVVLHGESAQDGDQHSTSVSGQGSTHTIICSICRSEVRLSFAIVWRDDYHETAPLQDKQMEQIVVHAATHLDASGKLLPGSTQNYETCSFKSTENPFHRPLTNTRQIA